MRSITVLAGTALLVFAGVQATFDRPPEAFLIAGVALVVVALVGPGLRLFRFGSPALGVTIEQAADMATQAADKAQSPDLKLLISTGMPVGGAEAWFDGAKHLVEVTAVNTSDRPIGVSSIGIELDNGRWLPGTRPWPSPESKTLPAVLGPQEQASVWWDHGPLKEVVDEEGVQIRSLIANLRDGTKVSQPVPDDWRSLK